MANTLNIEFYGQSDMGLKRLNNEDAYLINSTARFALVADGMGGAAAGEMASQIFVQTVSDLFSDKDVSPEQAAVELVQNAFQSANDRILDHVAFNPEHQGMGCTAELIAFTSNSFVIGHMGDSRTYRWRQNSFKQLTKDHSLVQDQIDHGLITEAEARSHAMRNVILRAVGVRPYPALDILRGPIASGDIFLLCSDGLTDLVEDAAIAEVIGDGSDIASQGNQLVELAKIGGGKDNITVVLAKIS